VDAGDAVDSNLRGVRGRFEEEVQMRKIPTIEVITGLLFSLTPSLESRNLQRPSKQCSTQYFVQVSGIVWPEEIRVDN
jgi:hypothetical protein